MRCFCTRTHTHTHPHIIEPLSTCQLSQRVEQRTISAPIISYCRISVRIRNRIHISILVRWFAPRLPPAEEYDTAVKLLRSVLGTRVHPLILQARRRRLATRPPTHLNLPEDAHPHPLTRVSLPRIRPGTFMTCSSPCNE